MKIMARNLGTFLVSAVAVALVLFLLSNTLIPELSKYINKTFPTEKSLEFISVVAADPDANHAAPTNGEIYATEHYNYTYFSSSSGWKVSVKDKTRKEYEPLNASIFGKPVVGLEETFKGCASLIHAPAIPATVKDMTSTFENCTALNGIIMVYAEPTTYEDCFKGTMLSISLKGTSALLEELKETSSSSNIEVE